jgi:hypothetical protein
MLQPARNGLEIVTVENVKLCFSCDQAYLAAVRLKNGTIRTMMHCARRDCDQWIHDFGGGERRASCRANSTISEPAADNFGVSESGKKGGTSMLKEIVAEARKLWPWGLAWGAFQLLVVLFLFYAFVVAMAALGPSAGTGP